ncbi:hypothetical protein D1AOALGA4SA_7327 [Olavius algarvensis Delta 1 endosymbiont]|nr:hypothetical protein D1AOALGA4SA_7327 [Olavius algarvensis Delta 1 endosymbiont]
MLVDRAVFSIRNPQSKIPNRKAGYWMLSNFFNPKSAIRNPKSKGRMPAGRWKSRLNPSGNSCIFQSRSSGCFGSKPENP